MRKLYSVLFACAVTITAGSDYTKAGDLSLSGYEYNAAHLRHVQYGGRDRDVGSARGSFVETCRNTQQRGWTIRSECRDRRGGWSWTSINFKHCPYHSVENLNGNLVCGR